MRMMSPRVCGSLERGRGGCAIGCCEWRILYPGRESGWALSVCLYSPWFYFHHYPRSKPSSFPCSFPVAALCSWDWPLPIHTRLGAGLSGFPSPAAFLATNCSSPPLARVFPRLAPRASFSLQQHPGLLCAIGDAPMLFCSNYPLLRGSLAVFPVGIFSDCLGQLFVWHHYQYCVHA